MIAPTGKFLTEFKQGENNNNGTIPAQLLDFVRFRVNPDLRFRKLYCFTQFQLSVATADYHFYADVELRLQGRTVGELPASTGVDYNNTLLTQSKSLASVFTACNAATNPPSRDSLLVTFSARFTGGDQAGNIDRGLLLPAYLEVECDEIVFHLKGWKVYPGYTNQGFRAYLACVSSNHQM